MSQRMPLLRKSCLLLQAASSFFRPLVGPLIPYEVTEVAKLALNSSLRLGVLFGELFLLFCMLCCLVLVLKKEKVTYHTKKIFLISDFGTYDVDYYLSFKKILFFISGRYTREDRGPVPRNF